MSLATSQNVSLPKNWPDSTKSAFLCAISLAHRAMVVAHSWCINSRISRVRLVAENQYLKSHLALTQEIQRIKDARWNQVLPQNRPHYPPTERLAILAIKAGQGWSKARTGREFAVTGETIARWLKRLDDDGEGALVALPTPVNRFRDFVTLVVQELKSICPSMGKQRIADTLARAGLHLSASTARRMIKNSAKSTPTGDAPTKTCHSKTPNCDRTQSASNDAELLPAKPKRVVVKLRPSVVEFLRFSPNWRCLESWGRQSQFGRALLFGWRESTMISVELRPSVVEFLRFSPNCRWLESRGRRS